MRGPSDRLPPRMRLRRGLTLVLLIAAGCISYIDRTALSVSSTAVMAELHMSYTTMGFLLSVFAWAYLAGQIPMGLLSDRFGSRILLGAGLTVWSCAQISFGFMHSIAGLFLARIGLGLGETPLFLSGTRALVQWYRPDERGKPIGLFNASAALGPAIAPPVLLAIMAVWGWRGMSISIGTISLLLAVVWIGFYRDPADLNSTKHEQNIFLENKTGESTKNPTIQRSSLKTELAHLLRQRTTWVITAGYAGVIYLTWLYATWMPAWLEKSRHLSENQAGLLSALPQFCGFTGSIIGGIISDRLSSRGITPLNANKIPLVIAMLVASLATALTTLPVSLPVLIMFMAIALFAGGLAMTCGWTLGVVIAGGKNVATLEAIQNTGGSLGGALAPAITGILADHFSSFTPSMLVASAVGTSCAIIYQFGLYHHEEEKKFSSLSDSQTQQR